MLIEVNGAQLAALQISFIESYGFSIIGELA